LLRAADVSFAYDPRAPVLRGVSMEVPARGFVGILGPNGSGKTTLLRILAGMIRPSRGQVRLEGQDLARTPRALLARRMAVVPQETHLAFDYSVIEVVLMGRYPHLRAFEIEGPADFAIARDALAATGTLEFEDRPFDTLSGGEKQRVIIAAALAQIRPAAPHGSVPLQPGGHDGARERSVRLQPDREPARDDARDRSVRLQPDRGRARDGRVPFDPDPPPGILLLDEPTAALDLAYQLELASLLRDLQERLPVSIVVSTHDLNFAASLCRTLVLLKKGEVLAAGDTGDVLTPERIRALYGVDAEVSRHAASGRLVVVPIRRTETGR
jgi:ABC-type cobalamin/Fe3+-siderophores transport system ATPase subunit